MTLIKDLNIQLNRKIKLYIFSTEPHFLIAMLFFCLVPILSCLCQDFGIQGELFKIEEENLLHILQKQLSGRKNLDFFQSSRRPLQPPSGRFLPSATQNRTFYYDPTYTLPHAITDISSSTLLPAGTQVNPLKTLQLSSGLLFLDGDNKTQIQWALQQCGSWKWILVRGNPYQLEKELHRPIFFDQQGVSIEKFKIEHLPARVTQDQWHLKIEEIALTPLPESP